MTIEEAIQVLKEHSEDEIEVSDKELLHALSLGLEALKRIKYYREELERNKTLKVHLLPGETEK
jgi:hypothetical protein